ncbi:Rieske 2Fe-2S domain-containing protein [Deinococcus maricopensis]|uniref:Rieske (2Fe-2S) iron-sulfur domain protein n=1 Tax=Deinococcus maricopensis (strain DSM 21211 / LMG 22137 / NRRL B-23946 / LB-34) TaxID=709986 RepID=E8U6V8_DEIML|nr:Rieske 2Fe-2S domain-containing protein [Deinococcus maricopensis]ADV66797.1 Rieske (2Fe-2S) iron-sulfur domain protein [Deinococcus maricopensis DSM 21211]
MPVTRRALLEKWWVLPVAATVGTFGWLGLRATRILTGKGKPGAPAFQAVPAVRVAALSALPGAWSSVNFRAGGRECVLLRLPSPTEDTVTVGGAHLAAFSRVCTHLGCAVNVMRDTEALAFSFNYRTDHPVLGCPCHFSVFDALERGQAVFGQALAPLPRVRLEARGSAVYATGLEPAPPLSS